jgi:hypothetical protein
MGNLSIAAQPGASRSFALCTRNGNIGGNFEMIMISYDPNAAKVFNSLCDSLSADERENLRWMLDCGLTPEAAKQLLVEGLNEETSSGSEAAPDLPLLFTQSARKDLECFGAGDVRRRLNNILRRNGWQRKSRS